MLKASPMPDDLRGNDPQLDDRVKHQVQVSRFAAGLYRRAQKHLDGLEQEIVHTLRTRKVGKAETIGQVDAIIEAVIARMVRVFDRIEKQLLAELRDFTEHEADFSSRLLAKHAPDKTKAVEGGRAWNEAQRTPIDGLTIAEWLANWRREEVERMRKEIRTGWEDGETTAQIIERLTG